MCVVPLPLSGGVRERSAAGSRPLSLPASGGDGHVRDLHLLAQHRQGGPSTLYIRYIPYTVYTGTDSFLYHRV